MSIPLAAPILPSTRSCLGFISVFASSACRTSYFRLLLSGNHFFICLLSLVVLSSGFLSHPSVTSLGFLELACGARRGVAVTAFSWFLAL